MDHQGAPNRLHGEVAGIDIVYATDHAALYRGDALAVLRELPAASVSALVTDPPYSSGGMLRGDRAQSVHSKYVQTDSVTGRALAGFSGDNRDQRGYGYWCALWLSEALRVVEPGGIAAVFTDWRQLPTTTDALQAAGFVWRGIVVWAKPNGRRTQGRFANNCEYVVWGTNGPRRLNALPHAPTGFHAINTPRERVHITQKPVELMRQLVRIAPPDATVLDPFTGSGSTGVAALTEGRRFIGVELSKHFAEIAATRLAEADHEPAR